LPYGRNWSPKVSKKCPSIEIERSPWFPVFRYNTLLISVLYRVHGEDLGK
jgi:hypothetical protein